MEMSGPTSTGYCRRAININLNLNSGIWETRHNHCKEPSFGTNLCDFNSFFVLCSKQCRVDCILCNATVVVSPYAGAVFYYLIYVLYLICLTRPELIHCLVHYLHWAVEIHVETNGLQGLDLKGGTKTALVHSSTLAQRGYQAHNILSSVVSLHGLQANLIISLSPMTPLPSVAALAD
ncbi:hypothetical protein T310_3697 [Rasamsonia emersonii CBS 393.64]|uniref:Uncharacterized protein n=1 Tax=Rasamsonia emersonii (strain ATCC 16479 / CBS 393.64 / IMI 116815) TaxID=1408163 RepID=A0A0F4YVF4_RASE3|nr:hypothetical protein T310_3697 [Rasamsonia emersonii CBS 393.64]KKA22262.1 hypothetical protein T310_3697 [Rasamsonia emersonii CBS 393.64]